LVIFMLMLHEELSTLLPGQWNGSDGWIWEKELIFPHIN
jgi:hypothetical protein